MQCATIALYHVYEAFGTSSCTQSCAGLISLRVCQKQYYDEILNNVISCIKSLYHTYINTTSISCPVQKLQ